MHLTDTTTVLCLGSHLQGLGVGWGSEGMEGTLRSSEPRAAAYRTSAALAPDPCTLRAALLKAIGKARLQKATIFSVPLVPHTLHPALPLLGASSRPQILDRLVHIKGQRNCGIGCSGTMTLFHLPGQLTPHPMWLTAFCPTPKWSRHSPGLCPSPIPSKEPQACL